MSILKNIFIALMMAFSTLQAQSAKVVYDLTSGNVHALEKQLVNSVRALGNYYKEEKIDFKVIVVISGDAYKYFVEDIKHSPYAKDDNVFDAQKKFKSRLVDLNDKYGVTFNMCWNGMSARNIKEETLYKYVHAEKMKSVYLIEAQNDGYAYMPIH